MALGSSKLRALRSFRPTTGNRVGEAIRLADLTQAEVAKATGLQQAYISNVSRGVHSTVTVDNARIFAEFFGCTIEDLFPSREGVAAS